MLETFKARLKAKTKASGVNLSTKRIDAYADRLHKKNPDVKDDAEHDTLIEALDELVSFSEIAKQDDQVRTLEAKVKATPAAAAEPEDDDDDSEGDDADDQDDKGKKPEKGKEPKKKERIPAWAKALTDEVKLLRADKAKATVDSEIAKLNKGEDGKIKVDEKILKRIVKPDKLEDVAAWFEEVESEFKGVSTDTSDADNKDDKGKKVHQPKRGAGPVDKKPDEKTVKSIVDKII